MNSLKDEEIAAADHVRQVVSLLNEIENNKERDMLKADLRTLQP